MHARMVDSLRRRIGWKITRNIVSHTFSQPGWSWPFVSMPSIFSTSCHKRGGGLSPVTVQGSRHKVKQTKQSKTCMHIFTTPVSLGWVSEQRSQVHAYIHADIAIFLRRLDALMVRVILFSFHYKGWRRILKQSKKTTRNPTPTDSANSEVIKARLCDTQTIYYLRKQKKRDLSPGFSTTEAFFLFLTREQTERLD